MYVYVKNIYIYMTCANLEKIRINSSLLGKALLQGSCTESFTCAHLIWNKFEKVS